MHDIYIVEYPGPDFGKVQNVAGLVQSMYLLTDRYNGLQIHLFYLHVIYIIYKQMYRANGFTVF